jgi:hypothetical protein
MKMLDVWPPLLICVIDEDYTKWGVDNIVAALEHKDRICRFDLLAIPSSQEEKVLARIQQPFPALREMGLQFENGNRAALIDPASFLGGSVPHLQKLWLVRIPFPGLPSLLLSATHLVELVLVDIPYSGFISPNQMVTCLSVLTKLERLEIIFGSPRIRPDRNKRSPPQTRTLLPVLTKLHFEGVRQYLEDLVVQIDAPLLDKLEISHRISDIPQLTEFIHRTPRLANVKAHVDVHSLYGSEIFSIALP